MDKQIEEIIEAIIVVNEEILEKVNDEDGSFVLTICSNGQMSLINFLGMDIWNSEEDCRHYDEKMDKYDSFEVFLRESVWKILNGLMDYIY